MTGRKHTVLWLSEDGERTRTFNVSGRGLKSAVIIAIVILLALAGSALYVVPRALDYNRLKSEQQAVAEERNRVASLIQDLNRIREMDSYIRQVLGTDLEFGVAPDAADTAAVPGSSRETVVTPISYLDNVPSYVPLVGFITQEFHRGILSREEDHLGLDVVAKAGSAVHAAASGMVVFSGWTYQHGNQIILYHGDDYFSVYGHNERNLVEERQFVERGELIALVGETGITTGPHLPFEIWT
ncbi:MAG: M23 family metallopeptidase, partial [Fidelibacterota bacterium]